MALVRVQWIEKITSIVSEIDKDTGFPEEDTEDGQSTKVLGNIQPIAGEELHRLQEGKTRTAFWNFWTETHPLEYDDILVHKGRRLRVEDIRDWDNISSTIPHYHYVLQDEGKIEC